MTESSCKLCERQKEHMRDLRTVKGMANTASLLPDRELLKLAVTITKEVNKRKLDISEPTE